MMVTRSLRLAELVETDFSARLGMKSAERSSLGPSLGDGKMPQKPSEPSNGHEAAACWRRWQRTKWHRWGRWRWDWRRRSEGVRATVPTTGVLETGRGRACGSGT